MELSFGEIALVCMIAFLVFGPEDFVRRSRQFGQWLGRMRTQARNFRVMAEEELTKKAKIEELDHLRETLLDEPNDKPEEGGGGKTDGHA